MLDGYITMKEAESQSKRCYRTLIKWIEEKRISGFKYGGQWMVLEQSLHDYIQECIDNF